MENFREHAEFIKLFEAVTKNMAQIRKTTDEAMEAVKNKPNLKEQLLALHWFAKFIEHKGFEMNVGIEELTIKRAKKYDAALKSLDMQDPLTSEYLTTGIYPKFNIDKNGDIEDLF